MKQHVSGVHILDSLGYLVVVPGQDILAEGSPVELGELLALGSLVDLREEPLVLGSLHIVVHRHKEHPGEGNMHQLVGSLGKSGTHHKPVVHIQVLAG